MMQPIAYGRFVGPPPLYRVISYDGSSNTFSGSTVSCEDFADWGRVRGSSQSSFLWNYVGTRGLLVSSQDSGDFGDSGDSGEFARPPRSSLPASPGSSPAGYGSDRGYLFTARRCRSRTSPHTCRARSSRSPPPSLIKKISAHGADTSASLCGGEVALDSCFRGRGRDGSLTFPPPPTRPYCRSRGLEARGLLRITALTQRGCKRTSRRGAHTESVSQNSLRISATALMKRHVCNRPSPPLRIFLAAPLQIFCMRSRTYHCKAPHTLPSRHELPRRRYTITSFAARSFLTLVFFLLTEKERVRVRCGPHPSSFAAGI
jgi:hypothetical protein